ncbi:MAG TPA: DNA-formamidopyrimidine glycosylase family protein, partial [Vicinamibacteria bacterium]|nr:DNA-formamidopyrimidine glycosylase family protein [Vicinamibacteria bacterium]
RARVTIPEVMPELPDVTVYIEALEKRILGARFDGLEIGNPFLLRSIDPAPQDLVGKKVERLRRLGKRIVIELEDDLFLAIHLMIAGRLHWKPGASRPSLPKKRGLARFDFTSGSVTLTEAGSKRRASLHLVRGESDLALLDRGGLEVFESDLEEFRRALARENHTLKRSLTDPRLFSGIGNAYSDEILHRARLSPVTWTSRLSEEETERLYRATRETLIEWTDELRRDAGDDFPEKVTAFRPKMAVHGRYRQPCPVCATPVQRIAYAENETNYCPRCQTGGKLLADRALSRLLREDWPKSLEELEELKAQKRV